MKERKKVEIHDLNASLDIIIWFGVSDELLSLSIIICNAQLHNL